MRRSWRWVVAGALALALAGCAQDVRSDGDRDDQRGAGAREPGTPAGSAGQEAEDGGEGGDGGDRGGSGPRPRTYLVVSVTDGDTLTLGNGEDVRLVGMDAPETGDCGSRRAEERLRDLTLGERVRLPAPVDDRDRYGRLLRYVDVGRVDAGLRLIREGLAVARYDSRDGYDPHARERRYVAADRASRPFACAPAPVPLAAPVPAGQPAGCAPGYEPCVPVYPPDLDCADTGPVRVTGPDPHGLDGDGDGRACGED